MSSDAKPPKVPSASTASTAGGASGDPRHERLAQALRDNLKKRKVQQRRRAGGPAAPRQGGDGPADDA
jgi:hypothetical protein